MKLPNGERVVGCGGHKERVVGCVCVCVCFGHLRDTVCCTELERPTLEGVFLKTRVSRWARSFRLGEERDKTGQTTNQSTDLQRQTG